jgi:hypothetical protein
MMLEGAHVHVSFASEQRLRTHTSNAHFRLAMGWRPITESATPGSLILSGGDGELFDGLESEFFDQ